MKWRPVFWLIYLNMCQYVVDYLYIKWWVILSTLECFLDRGHVHRFQTCAAFSRHQWWIVIVESNYVGTLLNNELTFEKNANSIYKKSHQHLFCIRKLPKFQIDSDDCYGAFIESAITFSFICWFQSLRVKEKSIEQGYTRNLTGSLQQTAS